MQDLIKRYFWILGVIAVVLCAVFAAKATGAIIEANFLGDPKQGPKIPPAPKPDTAAVKPVRSKDGTQFATRNVFCSECTPPVVAVNNTDPQAVTITTLPLQLLATNVGTSQESSTATIINTDTQKQGAFVVGDRMPGAS